MRRSIILLVIVLSLASLVSCAREVGMYLTFIGTISNSSVGVIRAKAQSQQTTSLIDNKYGIIHTEKRLFGATAVWLSEHTTIQGIRTEHGNISFGIPGPGRPAHIISFQSIGLQSFITYNNLQRGAGYYNVTGGLGAFRGAIGVLSSIMTFDPISRDNVQNVTGTFWIP